MTVAGLVLAAGAGVRFGQPKAPVVIDGERLVDRAVRVLDRGGLRSRLRRPRCLGGRGGRCRHRRQRRLARGDGLLTADRADGHLRADRRRRRHRHPRRPAGPDARGDPPHRGHRRRPRRRLLLRRARASGEAGAPRTGRRRSPSRRATRVRDDSCAAGTTSSSSRWVTSRRATTSTCRWSDGPRRHRRAGPHRPPPPAAWRCPTDATARAVVPGCFSQQRSAVTRRAPAGEGRFPAASWR